MYLQWFFTITEIKAALRYIRFFKILIINFLFSYETKNKKADKKEFAVDAKNRKDDFYMYLFNKDRIEETKPLLAAYLEQHHCINIKKPFHCLNPKHDDLHPSMSYDSKNHRCICFSCQCRYDIFDLVGIDYHITNTIDKFKKTYQIANELQEKEL